MRLRNIAVCIALCLSHVAAKADNLILIDTIKVVIYGQEGTELVTLSDLNRPPLGGGVRTPEDIVFERLVVLDAKKLQAMPTEEETDKTINTICRENGLTKEEFNEVARSAGYTPEGAREQFRNMHAASKMVDYKVRSKLIVPKKEVEAYCKEHPEWTAAEYQLAYSFVPYATTQTAQMQEKDLQAYINGVKMIAGVEWSDPFWVLESDIAQDYRFITALKPGEIKLHEVPSKGFELYKLVDLKPAHEKTAEERYFEVSEILRQPRGEQLMEEYKKSLYDSTSILYFN